MSLFLPLSLSLSLVLSCSVCLFALQRADYKKSGIVSFNQTVVVVVVVIIISK